MVISVGRKLIPKWIMHYQDIFPSMSQQIVAMDSSPKKSRKIERQTSECYLR